MARRLACWWLVLRVISLRLGIGIAQRRQISVNPELLCAV
jgi:hypothetical protein|eukprot:COSAG01_NODE_4526_length_4949_cov_4.355038_3_plen_40_part_00